jgi:hypothetical protein
MVRMKSKIFLASLCAAMLCCAASSLSAQALRNAPPPPPTDTQIELSKISDIAEVQKRADAWKAEGNMRRYTYAMERLLALRPYSPTFMYRLAEAYAMQNEKTKAYDLLIRVQKQGLAINPDKDKDFDPIRGTQAYKYIIDGLVTNATPWGEGKVAMTLKDAPELIESVAYDAKRKRFLIGSVRTGEILSVSPDGRSIKPFIKPASTPGLQSVFALAVDEARGFLWVGTAGAPQYVGHKPADMGFAALLKLDLAKGTLIEAYPLPADGVPKTFGAITVASNGTVYATDAIKNVIYQVQGGELRVLLSVPGSTSLRGITVTPDQKFLYFVDYELGLRVADLSKSEVRDLSKDGHNFGGIDGLYYYDGQLIAVQNGSIPTRIMRITLDTDRISVKGVQPLEANKDPMEMPTYGTLAGDDFYFIANSQRDVYGVDGKPVAGFSAEPRVLYQVSARFAWEVDDKGGVQRSIPNQ